MTDPYRVLNIPPTATDEEVKKAYRELARKYHPDNYNNNPLADLAQEKMKEINEAYDTITKLRSGQGGSCGTGPRRPYGGQSAYGSQSAYSWTYTSSARREENDREKSAAFRQVRAAIDRGDLSAAEHVLEIISDRGGEWHFLKGVIYCRRGWLEEGLRCCETACRLSPENMEYRQFLEQLRSRTQRAYRPVGYPPVFTTSCVDTGFCRWMLCSYCCCNCCSLCSLSHF